MNLFIQDCHNGTEGMGKLKKIMISIKMCV